MFVVLQTVTLILVAIAMALTLAHALPGKLRLSRDEYLAVQAIYYPGFTIGGAAEPLAIAATLALLLLTPQRTAFWLTAGSLVALAAMHATYWAFTHPVNNFWLKDAGTAGRNNGAAPDWTALRDRWEFSHVARAAFGMIALALLAAAVAT